MTRHYIKDSDGKDARNSSGERLFWSDSDGDWDRDHQTVYREHKSGGNSKTDSSYNPSTGKFSK